MSPRKPKKSLRIPGFSTCEQAAKKLKMKADTVRRYIHRGLITAGLLGDTYLISDAEIERFRTERRGPGNPNFQRKTACV
jgi:excisionase family DNA binding protein